MQTNRATPTIATQAWRRLACLFLAGLAALWSGVAQAQILDRIEINRIGREAEIRIHFASRVQYLRHAPLKEGRLLRIFVRLIDPDLGINELTQETVASPQTDLVPPFSLTFPDLEKGMLLTFAQPTRWDVRPGPDGRSLVVVVPLQPGARDVVAETKAVPTAPAAPVATAPAAPEPAPVQPAAVPPAVVAAPAVPTAPAPAVPEPAPAAEAAPAAPAMTREQIEGAAKSYFDDARVAVGEKDYARALNRLNRTLGLPTNAQTEAAQALIGEVRELNGEIAKARAEYELYLKLYPQGTETARIKDRLAKLPVAEPPRRVAPAGVPAKAGPAEWTFFGSLSQYWYQGKSHIEVVTPPPPGQLNFTTDTLSMTDQDALITNLDLNARRRDGITDTRIVVRDTNTQNYLARQRSVNRLYSAYVEQSDRRLGYLVRAGRQNPTGGGVLERFDGLFVGYNVGDRWRVNGVAGIPVEFNSPFKKSFYGVSVDMQPKPESVGLSGYFVQQDMEGVVNRQAVGLESRYFDPHASVYGMLDYDIVFGGINIAMLQGNYRTDAGTNYFTYLDHRKTPPYGLTNALPALPGSSIKEALDTVGVDQLRNDAKALTATSNMLAVGLTHPYSPRWLLGIDYRVAEISGTEATANFPALPGSGLNHVVSAQAIGNNLWAKNDVGVLNGSLIFGPNYTGQAIGGNYVFLYGDAWRLDGNLRYYRQTNDQSERQVRLSPSFKIGYRWKLVTLEAEFGSEDVRIDGPARTERSRRNYLFVGYRADLR